MKTFQTIQVTPEEKILIKASLGTAQLRNNGLAYRPQDFDDIMAVFHCLKRKDQAQFAHLVTQAMGSDPSWYGYFQVTDAEMEQFCDKEKNPTLLGNLAFMAIYGPSQHQWRFEKLLMIYEEQVAWRVQVRWFIAIICLVVLLMMALY